MKIAKRKKKVIDFLVLFIFNQDTSYEYINCRYFFLKNVLLLVPPAGPLTAPLAGTNRRGRIG